MRFSALVHAAEASHALTQSERVSVLGSAALLVRDETLGLAGAPLALTRDVDLLVEPCDAALAALVHEALGEGSLFDQRFGYHVDVLRPTIAQTLPGGWRERAVALAQHLPWAWAAAAEDIAAAKVRVGRPKDQAVVVHLLASGALSASDVGERLREMRWTEAEMRATVRRLAEWVALAGG